MDHLSMAGGTQAKKKKRRASSRRKINRHPTASSPHRTTNSVFHFPLCKLLASVGTTQHPWRVQAPHRPVRPRAWAMRSPPSPVWGSLWRSCKYTVSKVNNTIATPFLQKRLYMSIGVTARREKHNSNGCNTVSKVNNKTATPFLQEPLYLSIGFTTRSKQPHSNGVLS